MDELERTARCWARSDLVELRYRVDEVRDVAVHEEVVGIGAAEHDDPDRVVGLDLGEPLEQSDDERRIDQVQRRGVDGDDHDAAVLLDPERARCHAPPFTPR